jgi:hypothetical protein
MKRTVTAQCALQYLGAGEVWRAHHSGLKLA